MAVTRAWEKGQVGQGEHLKRESETKLSGESEV